MRQTVMAIGIVVLAAALAMVVPSVLTAHQEGQGQGMSSGMGHRMGMRHGMPMGHGMGMMMGMGHGGEKLSDADRGELLVLKGRMMKIHAELMKNRAEGMIAEGERLQKGGK